VHVSECDILWYVKRPQAEEQTVLLCSICAIIIFPITKV